MTTETAIATFEVGKTYSVRSACDYDCIFRFTVTRRTAKTITVTYHGEQQTRGIRVLDSVEHCFPLGRYTMAPMLGADRMEA